MYSDERRGEGSRGSGGNGVRFTVLGPLEVLRDGIDHAPKTPKVLQLLAVLVTRPGRMVHIDTLIQELKSGPPKTTGPEPNPGPREKPDEKPAGSTPR